MLKKSFQTSYYARKMNRRQIEDSTTILSKRMLATTASERIFVKISKALNIQALDSL